MPTIHRVPAPAPGPLPQAMVCRSNLVEALLGLLARGLGEVPLASPFTPGLVVVPRPAMARRVHLGPWPR